MDGLTAEEIKCRDAVLVWLAQRKLLSWLRLTLPLSSLVSIPLSLDVSLAQPYLDHYLYPYTPTLLLHLNLFLSWTWLRLWRREASRRQPVANLERLERQLIRCVRTKEQKLAQVAALEQEEQRLRQMIETQHSPTQDGMREDTQGTSGHQKSTVSHVMEEATLATNEATRESTSLILSYHARRANRKRIAQGTDQINCVRNQIEILEQHLSECIQVFVLHCVAHT